jgi:hypothetical protein
MALYNTGGQNISGQFGMPLFGISGVPFPAGGNYFWVDGTNGSDGNTGGPQDPLKTLTQAQNKCLAGNNDVVFFYGTFSPSATFVWSKNNTHLIGLSPDPITNNALISVASTAATSGAFSPLVSVTASGCLFQNISALSGINQAATQVCWAESGGNNCYYFCNFNQVGNATAGAQAGNRALTIASVGCTFTSCAIGGDSIVRATGTNFTAEFLAGGGSTIFRNCVFAMWSSNAANLHINASAATTIAGYVWLNGCLLVNDVNKAGGTNNTVAMISPTTSTGVIVLDPGTTVVGASAVVSTGGAVWTGGTTAVAANGSLAIIAT